MVTRIKGETLTLEIAGTAYEDEIKSFEIVLEESDNDPTFGELSAGTNYDQFIDLVVVSDYSSTSLHTALTDAAGTEVAFLFNPGGNATPTTDEPHWEGTARIPRKPGLGGSAGEAWEFELRLEVVGEATKVTA